MRKSAIMNNTMNYINRDIRSYFNQKPVSKTNATPTVVKLKALEPIKDEEVSQLVQVYQNDRNDKRGPNLGTSILSYKDHMKLGESHDLPRVVSKSP